jgi:Ca2+-binding RTX toxin-like protein
MANHVLLKVAVLISASVASFAFAGAQERSPNVIDVPVPTTPELSTALAGADSTTEFTKVFTAPSIRPTCFGRPATILGTDWDDDIVGTASGDVIVAGDGNDVVRAGRGVDFVCGGLGDDRIVGGPNPNVGGFDRDPPRGDRLSGEEGDDYIVDGGGGFSDVLRGGPGDDRLRTRPNGYAEHRVLRGGPGADRITSAGSLETALVGGPGPDVLTSAGHNHVVTGEAGADVLTLAGSGDTIVGIDADGDRIRVTRAGYVVLLPDNDIEAVELDLAAGTVRRLGAATGDVLVFDRRAHPPGVFVWGTDGDDRISGWDFDETVLAGNGNDVLGGRGGDDSLDGGRGNDALDGGDGDDRVDGGRGVDSCINAESLSGCSP